MKWMTVIVAIGLLLLLYPIVVFFLWNWLMPSIFGISKITFAEAIGITILSDILFKTNRGSKND